MSELITAILCGIIAIVSFIFSYMQFHEKGFLFNNAYIYATKEQREKMNKKPFYKQSSVVFFLLGLIFTVNAVDAYLKTGWLFYVILVIAAIAIIYAIASTIKIEKENRQ